MQKALMTPEILPLSIPVIAGVNGVHLGGENGALLATLDSGALLTATGRSADGSWLAVQSDAGSGWVQMGEVIAYDVQQLPVTALPETVVTSAQQLQTTPGSTAALTTTEQVTATTASTATASVAETKQLTATVSTGGGPLNVRSGPGTEYPVVTKAATGDELGVIGRTAAGDWLQVQLPGSAQEFGWVAAMYVQVNGDSGALPVSDAVSTAPALASAAASSTSSSPAAGVANVQSVAAPAAGATGLQGALVFQQSTGGMIYAYDLATGKLWPLTNGADPAISPDGNTVAFVRNGGQNGIYLINIDGSNERLIFNGRNDMSSPKWSPDGNWIVFSREDEYIECYDLGNNQCLSKSELQKRFPFGLPNNIEAPLIKQYMDKLAVVDRDGNNYHDIPSLDSAKAPDWSTGGIVYQSNAGL
ncbi:MAG TPA: SH3 domain-containing protein, partial [Caldilineaceae bacterium]|nr:SH3 domain-containing protein [Caldilineaceae bacterium]